MFRVMDRLVPSPDTIVVGHQPAVAEHPHPMQVSDDLDTSPDHRRMHRIVVGVQPNVVIPRQPRRGSPTGHRRHRRQRQHRGPVSVDPISRPATQHPMLPVIRSHEEALQLLIEIRRRGKAAAG